MENEHDYPDIKENLNTAIEKLRNLQAGTTLTNAEIDAIIADLNNVYTRLVLVGE